MNTTRDRVNCIMYTFAFLGDLIESENKSFVPDNLGTYMLKTAKPGCEVFEIKEVVGEMLDYMEDREYIIRDYFSYSINPNRKEFLKLFSDYCRFKIEREKAEANKIKKLLLGEI